MGMETNYISLYTRTISADLYIICQFNYFKFCGATNKLNHFKFLRDNNKITADMKNYIEYPRHFFLYVNRYINTYIHKFTNFKLCGATMKK